MAENIMDTLRKRGFIKQTVFEDELYEKLGKESVPFYIGFDPTADSLHVGHFLTLIAMHHMQQAGHKPIILIGGGTGMVGDPSGRTDMRQMMTRETVDYHCECFRKQMSRFIDFGGENGAVMVNNADWLANLNYIDFLREIGVHFSVNKMLTAECFKSRYERGLSFLEFNYMLMQAYDFLVLYRKYGCRLELGGDDQWSNILAGADLIRRKEQQPAFAMTFTLLTTSGGRKMGKTAKGAVWLDENKTSPYEFYQYWRNIGDADVMKCLRMLTFIPVEELEEIDKWNASRINEKKELLAYELTNLVHGEEEANKAREASHALFTGIGDDSNMPTTQLTENNISQDGISIVNLLVLCKLATSKTEARRLILQGGIRVDGQKVDKLDKIIGKDMLADGVKIRKGKKVFHRAMMKL